MEAESVLNWGISRFSQSLTGPLSCSRVSLPGSLPVATAPVEIVFSASSKMPTLPLYFGSRTSSKLAIAPIGTSLRRVTMEIGPHCHGTAAYTPSHSLKRSESWNNGYIFLMAGTCSTLIGRQIPAA